MRWTLTAAVLLLSTFPLLGQGKPCLDRDGDPLPDGALVRMGTTRFRHGGMPTGVVFLDAKTLLSSGGDGVLRVWEVPSGRQLRELRGATYSDMPLAHEGDVVLGVTPDSYFAAWDARTGKLLRKFGYGSYPVGVGLHKDRLVFGRMTEATVWDMDGSKPRTTLAFDKTHLHGLALSGDGRLVATATMAGIRLWDAASGQMIREWAGHGESGTWQVHFSPGESKLLASTGRDKTARLWDVSTGKELHSFGSEWATAVAFSPDGKHVALGGKWDEEGVALFDLGTYKRVRRFEGGPRYNAVNGLAFSPDGKYLAASGIESAVQLFEVATGKALNQPDQPQASIRDMFLSADGKTVVVGGSGVEVNVWDVATGRRIAAVPKEQVGLPAGFGKDGRVLLGRVGSFEVTFYWFDPVTGKDERVVRVPHSPYHVALAPDDRSLVVVSTANGNMGVWDLAKKGAITSLLERPPDSSFEDGLALSPDGRRLAAVGTVRSVETGEIIRTLTPGHGRTVNGLAFSPDGKSVATVSALQILIYDAEGAGKPRALPLPDESGYAAAYHPDGRMIAVGEREGVAIHDATTGKMMHRFVGHRGIVRRLAFTPSGQRLVSGGNDGSLLVWDMAAVTIR